MERRSWDARYASLLERVMAAAVANLDPRPLQAEMESLMAERPKEGRAKDGTAKRKRTRG
jgi:hypothetical protein